MSDDLLNIPQVPDAKPDDPEDVSWALSTAEAMWARGDHSEGIKWVRRAAEAASEAENDNRALELAKAAADLQGMITRRSLADKGSERNLAAAAKTTGPTIASPSGPVSSVPATSRSVPPISRAPATKQSVPPKPSGRSIPPIPLPSKASSPPAANASGAPPANAPSAPPAAAPAATKSAPRPLATGTGNKAQGPQAGKGVLSNKASDKKGRRRSRENLEDEAKAAGVLDTSPHAAVTPADTDEITALSSDDAIPLAGKAKGIPFDSDATMIGSRDTIEKGRKTSRGAEDWDASPTQNIPGDGAIDDEGDRKTSIGGPPAIAPSVTAQRVAPASMPPRPPRASPSIIPHDDSIKTSQAIRVVVWRDANGVHVAPEGTVVSAIKIDAMLVALEPTADLTAWLSRRG